MSRPSRREFITEIQAGFALVGVVMFILVLTILGLSLFSLSSFEAQFMQNSMDRSQCFFAAMGGLERAKWVLMKTSRLEDVQQNLPRDSVDYAEARQGSIDWASANASGPVVWNGDPVWIRVRATVGDASRMYEARFQPTRPPDIYRRLMSLSALHDSALIVTEYDTSSPNPRWTQTDLLGEVWQNSPQTFRADPVGTAPTYDLSGGVPNPDLDSYFARVAHLAQPVNDPTSSDPVSLNGSTWPNDIGLFKTFGPSSADSRWSVRWDTGNPRIHVSGTAIWMVDRGFWVQNRLDIENTPGGPDDLLVLVAKPNAGDLTEPGAGIALIGGLQSPMVPLILVSSGRIGIEHENNVGGTSLVSYLSIFASHALIMGPQAPDPNPTPLVPPRLTLTHPVSGLPPQLDALIDKLYELKLLPNTEAGLGAKLTPVAGTWHELTSFAAPN